MLSDGVHVQPWDKHIDTMLLTEAQRILDVVIVSEHRLGICKICRSERRMGTIRMCRVHFELSAILIIADMIHIMISNRKPAVKPYFFHVGSFASSDLCSLCVACTNDVISSAAKI